MVAAHTHAIATVQNQYALNTTITTTHFTGRFSWPATHSLSSAHGPARSDRILVVNPQNQGTRIPSLTTNSWQPTGRGCAQKKITECSNPFDTATESRVASAYRSLRNTHMSRSPHTRDDVGTPCVRVRACLPPIQMPWQPCTINTLSITPTSVPNSGGYLFWPGAPSHSSPHSPASRQRTHITNRL
ncbi:hypothetical protein TGGT1_411750, partial [Toxoplasma gondii GT1]